MNELDHVVNALKQFTIELFYFIHNIDHSVYAINHSINEMSYVVHEMTDAVQDMDHLVDTAQVKLHIGSGPVALDGWINVDVLPYDGVHVLSDVRHGLPFAHVEFMFAEHFLEHLTLADGLQFLRECRRVLADDGVLRLSTPNLDWVWLTHYKPPSEMTKEEELIGCLEINRAFHGWGHQFLYNKHVLGRALRSAGFVNITERAYGESEIAELRDMERHERHRDLPGAPSVLVVEASGHGESDKQFERVLEPYLRDAVTH